jgi:hypothetical protein
MNYGRPWVSPNTNAGSWQALGLPTSAKVAKLLTILPNAAELYRRQIALGLDGAHPQITLKVRLALRELLGQIKPRARRRWQPVGGLLGAAVGVGAGCRIRVCRLRDSNPRPPDYKFCNRQTSHVTPTQLATGTVPAQSIDPRGARDPCAPWRCLASACPSARLRPGQDPPRPSAAVITE